MYLCIICDINEAKMCYFMNEHVISPEKKLKWFEYYVNEMHK